MPDRRRLLVLWSLLYLASAAVGTLLSIRDHLPAEFGGILHGDNVPADFLTWMGTALSPSLVMLVAQVVLTILALRAGRAGVVGAAGLGILGAMYLLGQLGEPVLLRALTGAIVSPAVGVILATNLLFSLLMAVFGAMARRAQAGRLSTAVLSRPNQ